jgi:hypothetical protein
MRDSEFWIPIHFLNVYNPLLAFGETPPQATTKDSGGNKLLHLS